MATEEQMADWFEKHEDEHCNSSAIPEADLPFPQKDLCAFALISKRLPNRKGDLICSASHDEIWLAGPDFDEEGWPFTEEDVIYLLRCGISWDSETSSFHSFV